ncbi:MAG: pyridoxamine 5'-phosphate oxidase family protein [Ilumatobacteraceae bacterium]
MANRRAQIAMTDDEVRLYLDEQRVLNVATLGPSGHPHLVAMWYALIEGKVQFWTFAKSQKIVNLRRDPKMTGLIESGDSYNELKGVELVGNGQVIDDYERILHLGKELAVRYNGPAALADELMPFIEAQARKRLAVEFEVERVVSWDHSKITGY